ncbi:hypothetical protein [Lactovum odontotermitis]
MAALTEGGTIQHDPEIAAAFTSSVQATTGSMPQSASSPGSPNSVGIKGISDAFEANGSFPGKIAGFAAQVNGFADQVTTVSSRFEAFDKSEAAKFGLVSK